MRVPFLDLRIADQTQRSEILAAVDAVLCHGRLVLGPEVETFEAEMKRLTGRRFAVGVNSGTDALFLAIRALGIGPGDEVITTSLSWIATTNAIALTGAQPVFADIREDLNLDPCSVERLLTPRTKAILPVHYTGKPCDLKALTDLATSRGVALVEDAAQAFGASYQGRPIGSFGEIACFSMNPMKVLAACGEAGVIVTDRADLYERLVSLRYNGTVNRERCIEPSLNARLDTIQAAILLKRLTWFEDIIAKRRKIAAWYTEGLEGVVKTPEEGADECRVYYTYTIQADRRDELQQYLADVGIETKIQHPYLMPLQPAYHRNACGEWGRASELQPQILCLPVHEKLSRDAVEYVSEAIRRFYRGDQA